MKKILSFIYSLVTCQRCRGMGVTDDGNDTKECTACNGKGFFK